MLKSSQKDVKLATPSLSKVSQAMEGVDRLREVICRNDCVAQGSELAGLVDATRLSEVPVCKPLEQVELKRAKEFETVEWMKDLERGNNDARQGQRLQLEEKLKTLQHEHESRLAERATILEQELVRKLEEEHVQYK